MKFGLLVLCTEMIYLENGYVYSTNVRTYSNYRNLHLHLINVDKHN